MSAAPCRECGGTGRLDFSRGYEGARHGTCDVCHGTGTARAEPEIPPTPAAKVANVATMWRDRRNTAEIGRALKVSEPEALRLLTLARVRGLLERGESRFAPGNRHD